MYIYKHNKTKKFPRSQKEQFFLIEFIKAQKKIVRILYEIKILDVSCKLFVFLSMETRNNKAHFANALII